MRHMRTRYSRNIRIIKRRRHLDNVPTNQIDAGQVSSGENYVALGIYDASAINISDVQENES